MTNRFQISIRDIHETPPLFWDSDVKEPDGAWNIMDYWLQLVSENEVRQSALLEVSTINLTIKLQLWLF